MPAPTHKFQPPKGTRDFYPPEMAVRRHLESIWRRASVHHGFDEIDGPTFEHLELYTVKSGPGIVSELFSFRRAGGETDYALRPEFTPTLARMAAARGPQLAKPIKWFTIPSHFRAERPQRGRLREFLQWNVDVVGAAEPWADAEVIAVAVSALEAMRLTPEHVKIKVSHRQTVSDILLRLGLPEKRLPAAFDLLDRRDKLPAEALQQQAAEVGFSPTMQQRFEQLTGAAASHAELAALAGRVGLDEDVMDAFEGLHQELESLELSEWITYDLGIVRGLAYYTGTVFEIHEATGRERAIAGGGRYDQLVEQFGGPPTPAVGFAMGDVVIRLVLEDHGLLEAPEAYLPRPDVFLVSAGGAEADQGLRRLAARLRRAGLHVRHSYRSTRNVGKLLGEGGRSGARLAVILGRELADGQVSLKDLRSGDQQLVVLDELPGQIRQLLR